MLDNRWRLNWLVELLSEPKRTRKHLYDILTYLWVLLVYMMLEVCEFSEAVGTFGQLSFLVPDSPPFYRRLIVLHLIIILLVIFFPDNNTAPGGVINSLSLFKNSFFHYSNHQYGIFIVSLSFTRYILLFLISLNSQIMCCCCHEI